MDRRIVARALTTLLLWVLMGAVVLVYAYVGIAVMTAIFGPAADALRAANDALPP